MAEEKQKKQGQVILTNVRLSFAHIFKAQKYEGDDGGTPKFNCSFLINKESDQGVKNYKMVKAAIEAAKKAKWADNIPRLKDDKLCLRDGDNEEWDGYADNWYVSASNSKRPLILDRDKSPLTEEDGRPYSGCYVDAVIRVWAQDNKYGKRVNASLEAIRFRKDGEAFGAEPVDPDEFDDLEDDDDDEPPAKKKRRPADDDDDDAPPPKKKRRPADDEDDDEPPARKKRRPVEDDEDDEPPPPKKKRRPVEDDEDDEPPARKPKRRPVDDDDDL